VFDGVDTGFDGQPGALEAVAVGRDLQAGLVGRPHLDVEDLTGPTGELLSLGGNPVAPTLMRPATLRIMS